MRATTERLLCALLVFASVGCDSEAVDGPPRQEDSRSAAGSFDVASLLKRPHVDQREHFRRISVKAPDFAGLYFARDTGMVLSVTRSSGVQPAVSAVREEFLASVDYDQDPKVKLVEFSYRDLYAQYEALFRAAGFEKGKGFGTSIDVRTNRLVVWAEDDAHQASIRQRAQVEGIPAGMLDIRRGGKVERLADLNDRVRPMLGGMRVTNYITYPTVDSMFNCTMHSIALDANGNLGFLVNSHCTPSSNVDGMFFFQHAKTAADKIGVETIDPTPYSWCGTTTPFIAGCRWADVAFIKIDAPLANSTNFRKGYIARTTTGTTIASTPWRIVGLNAEVTLGEVYQKTGRSTGTTGGPILDYCTDEFVPLPGGQFIVYRCQVRAYIFARPGDSGSPVYRQYPSLGADAVVLEGIMWGGYDCDAQNNCAAIIYSPMSGVKYDLGILSNYGWLP